MPEHLIESRGVSQGSRTDVVMCGLLASIELVHGNLHFHTFSFVIRYGLDIATQALKEVFYGMFDRSSGIDVLIIETYLFLNVSLFFPG